MYVLINGVDTRDYGLRVTALPSIQIAQKRVELITIPGRSGYLTRWDGAYEEAIKTVGFFYNGQYPERAARFLLEGKTATFSNESDKVYDCRIDITTELINTIAKWHQFDVQLICNPVKRETSPREVTASVPPVVLVSPCNHPAYPIITLVGSGDVTLTVGDQEVLLTDIGPEIVIDGNLLDCLQNGALANNKMTGDFPVINPGETVSIGWTGSVTKVQIYPNWRWV